MADEQDAATLGAQGPQHRGQMLGFGAGQVRGGLVENDDPCPLGQRASDSDQPLLRRWEVTNSAGWVDVGLQGGQVLGGAGSDCGPGSWCRPPFGGPRIPARIEISPRALWLPTQLIAPIALAVHDGYESAMPAIPPPALEESFAEKLAAWRRGRKLRDLYDLDLYGRGALAEPLIRRLLVLNVWHDVVDDGLGT